MPRDVLRRRRSAIEQLARKHGESNPDRLLNSHLTRSNARLLCACWTAEPLKSPEKSRCSIDKNDASIAEGVERLARARLFGLSGNRPITHNCSLMR